MVRKALLRIGAGLVLIIAIVLVTIALRWDRHFDAPYPKLAASTDPALVARGRYLAYGPAHCAECHTSPGPRLAGGTPMETAGAKAITVTPPNITGDSTGRAALWTEDDFVARFRAGERISGSPMPWVAFSRMSDDDLRAIYRYLRSVHRT